MQALQSLDLDWRLAAADLRGSVAHISMLGAVGLLSSEEARTLEEHLKGVGEGDPLRRLSAPRAELEDVHMTIEARLTGAAVLWELDCTWGEAGV